VLPIDEQISPHQLPLLAGLAVRSAAAEVTADNGIDLKWPNDLLYGGKKIGGLLCERVQNVDLVGLGLNVNRVTGDVPRPLRGQAEWLSEILGGTLDLTNALVTVAAHLRRTLARGAEEPFASLLGEYDAHHALIGRRVTILGDHHQAPLTGRCEGLDQDGRLLITARGKIHRMISGRVMMR
jgi:BirA family biotin operon repressor/biotin-[acetyl-CoA-carboxylase] ligase